MDIQARNQALENFEKTSFYPSDILAECPKFRVLVVGQTGSGKSTLCSKVFRVTTEDGKEDASDVSANVHRTRTQIRVLPMTDVGFTVRNKSVHEGDGDTPSMERDHLPRAE